MELKDTTEYCSRMNIDFTLSPGKDKTSFNQQVSKVLSQIHGYLNYVGGILILNADKACSEIHIDEWIRNTMDRLLRCTPQSVVSKMRVKMHKGVFIFVRKSPELVTMNYHMYTRGLGANTQAVTDLQSCTDILTRVGRLMFLDRSPSHVSPGDMFKGVSRGTEMDIAEHFDLEFKCWKEENKLLKLTSNNPFCECLAAYANLQDGGDLVGGVDENQAKKMMEVKGYNLNERQKREVEKLIAEIFSEKMMRLDGNKLMENIDWITSFIPLHRPTHDDLTYCLLHIRVNHVAGGVLYGGNPECSIATTRGDIRSLTVDEWKTLVNHEKGKSIKLINNAKMLCFVMFRYN